MLDAVHKPVLLKEVLEIFNPQPGETYVDATINGGGHSAAILEKIGLHGILLGIDWDCDLIEKLKVKSQPSSPEPRVEGKSKVKSLVLVCDNYVNIGPIVRKHNLDKISGILFDLGFSTHHLEASYRGFSFLKNEPLDMRYSPNFNELTAEKIINTWPVKTIEDIIRNYGEERYAGRISRGLQNARAVKNITKTNELVAVIKRSVPPSYLRGKIHPATRTFQALRIAVNRELENLKEGLDVSLDVLAPGGKIAVISFHSLEDRIVKNFFREAERNGMVEILTPKPLTASREEIELNPRSRSAKLRAIRKF